MTASAHGRGGPWVFINSDLCDRELASKLRDWFKERHFTAAIPLAKAKPREMRQYLTANLQGSDAVVLVQGECDETWVSRQLLELVRQERQRPTKLRALGLCQLPPPEKEDPAFLPGYLVTIDGKQGLTPAFWAKLEAFASTLEG